MQPVPWNNPELVPLATRPGTAPNSVPAATAGLNGDLQSFLRNQQAKGRLARNDSTALVAYDLTSNTYLASHNAQRSFQAASMIKPFFTSRFLFLP